MQASTPKVAIADIVAEASKHPARLAVITGGEPLMYDLTDLTASLKNAGFQTNIETSGAYPLSGQLDWVCVSPKKFKPVLDECCLAAHELKVVVYHRSDFEWAEQIAAKVSSQCRLLLQPEWGRQEEMTPLIVDYVKSHPQWRVSLQTHKYMAIP